jgi:hypothetical protein
LQTPDQLDGTGVDFVRGWVTGIDADAQTVHIDDAYTLRYDTLVYALGSVADMEAVPGVDEFAYTLNSAQDAALLAEQLDRLADGTVVVAGGGLTGIESAADLELVGPLWVAVHHQHAESMPRLAPYVSDDETWRVRRALYEELLARADTLLLLAFVDDTAVGYGLTHVLPVDETWTPDTWVTGARIGEIESLSVLPQYRGSGLGSELLDRSSSTYTQPASRI